MQSILSKLAEGMGAGGLPPSAGKVAPADGHDFKGKPDYPAPGKPLRRLIFKDRKTVPDKEVKITKNAGVPSVIRGPGHRDYSDFSTPNKNFKPGGPAMSYARNLLKAKSAGGIAGQYMTEPAGLWAQHTKKYVPHPEGGLTPVRDRRKPEVKKQEEVDTWKAEGAQHKQDAASILAEVKPRKVRGGLMRAPGVLKEGAARRRKSHEEHSSERSPTETAGRVMQGLGAGMYGGAGLAGLHALHGRLQHGAWSPAHKLVTPLVLGGLGTRIIGRGIEHLGKREREKITKEGSVNEAFLQGLLEGLEKQALGT